jgi:ABC-type Na+ efflux pump permease subunit
MGRVTTITGNTLTGLVRLKIFYGLLLFALLLIGASAFMAQMSLQQEFQVLKDVGLGAISIFTSLLAILATARLVPQDIEDRTAYTLLAKPVSRFEYLAGKLFGVFLLLAISVIAMAVMFFLVLFFREQTVLSSGEQTTEARDAIRAAAFNPNLVAGITVIYAKACLLASLTLFVSIFASSTIFTVIVMAFVYFIGHLQSIAREYWLQSNTAGWFTKTFLALVALLFPDLQLFNLTDDIVAGNPVPLLLLSKTIAMGLFYCAFYLALAWTAFFRKEL